jgi:8-amino-7-oxononanoate synthase
MQQEPERLQHLHQLIQHLQQQLRLQHWQLMPSSTAIQPLIVGDDQLAVALSNHLAQQGFYVPAIRPPTVPAGSARLRISLSAAHSLAQVDALIVALQQAEQELLQA